MSGDRHASLLARVAEYYGEAVREHGDTPRGVDWNSAASQRLRFDQLLKILPESASAGQDPVTLLDYGCGYGALADVVAERVDPVRYVGFDVSDEMLVRARGRSTDGRTFIATLEGQEPLHYAVASGVLNVKLETPVEEWAAYALDVIAELDRCSTRGFAFNALTSWSDPERKIEQLWYPDPARIFDHCKRAFSRNVALLHDYGLWEFTILVRKDVA